VKRILGALIAFAAVGAAAASVQSVDTSLRQKSCVVANDRANSEARETAEQFTASIKRIEPIVSTAANIPQLVAMLGLARSGDPIDEIARTIQRGFEEEQWWARFRREFMVNAISIEGNSPEVVFGAQSKDIAATDLIQRAVASGFSTGIVEVAGKPAEAGAQPIEIPGRERPAVLLLIKPLTPDRLMPIATEKKAVAIARQKTTSVVGGDATSSATLTALIAAGNPPQEKPVANCEEAAASFPISQDYQLWVLSDNRATVSELSNTASTTKMAIFGGAGLVALLALFLSFRRAGDRALSNIPPTATTERGMAAPGIGQSGGAIAGTQSVSPIGETMAIESSPRPTQSARDSNTFGRYTLLDILGEGGMARVFTAVTFGAEGFRRKFVVKRLRPELSGDAAVVAQFIDEANLASTLVHSNIVPVFDFGKVGEEYFMATEYILGRDLGRVVARSIESSGKPLSVPLCLLAMSETLKALDYAHRRKGDDGKPLNIVHRDISPANILISARGEVKLFDFGIVKAEGRVTQTQHGVVKGNVNFMSPEQARGAEVDARADLFSLGLVLYYCATGQLLYGFDGTSYELLVKAATGPGVDELARIRQLPAPLPELLGKVLAYDPKNRYASAVEFGKAIDPYLPSGTGQFESVMAQLFESDFQTEENRFSSVAPSDPSRRTDTNRGIG